MSNMWQRLNLGILCLLLGATNVSSSEFRQIDELFSALNTTYIQALDFNDVVQQSCDLVRRYDDELKFYHSHKKVFLYQNNELISTIEIPQNNDIALWQNFITSLLRESAEHSDKIAPSATHLEHAMLKNTLQKLDKYSRLERKVFSAAGADYRIKDNILYIRCDSFVVGTSDIIKKIVNQYPQIKGFILDLRENQGGSFNEAIKTADLFLDEGIIAYRAEKNTAHRFYNATAGDILEGHPIVVLTSGHTASAAEIVTAALHEQGRATLIGAKTYGKGSIQQVDQFFNQQLYLTSGYFFSPSGQIINHIGIKPDICTDENQSDKMHDLNLAMEFIKQRIS